jgi:hypothetical protein
MTQRPFPGLVMWSVRDQTCTMLRGLTTLVVAGLVCGTHGSIYNFSAVPIDGSAAVNLAEYRGNVTIVVNVAT